MHMALMGWAAGRNWVDPHVLLLALAFVAAIAGGALLTLGDDRRTWREASAEVLSVRVTCELAANSFSYRRRPRSVVVPCADVEQFRQDNPNYSWRLRRHHMGDVRVVGGGETVVFDRSLGMFGRAPRVGDRVTVIQDPTQPSRIALPDGGLSLTMTGAALAGFGLFLGALAFLWF
jgi:hypothetical protein